MKILGFPYTDPFTILQRKYEGMVYAKELLKHLGNVVYRVEYYVKTKSVRAVHGDHMKFGTFIDCRGNLFDTVHFPQCTERFPFSGKGCYLIKGTVIQDRRAHS